MPRHLKKPLSDPKFLADVEKNIREARRSHTIGDLIMWRIDRAEVSPEDLEKLLAKRGLKDFLPTPIRGKVAARKAIAGVRKDLEEGNLKVLMRKIRDNDTEVRYALVDEEADTEAAALDYSERNQVIFNKVDATITFKGEPIPEILEQYDYYNKTYTQRELLIMVENVVHHHGGLRMNDGSGMWFMPVAVQHITDALKEFLNHDVHDNHGKAFFRALGITDSERDRTEMGNIVQSDLMIELEDAQEKLDEILSKDEPGRHSMKFALDRYKIAAGRAKMYKDLLSISLEEIEEEIAKGQRKLEKLLGVDDEDEEDWLEADEGKVKLAA
jgi:hypothetical protein